MKKIIFLLSIVIFTFFLTGNAFAVIPTATPSAAITASPSAKPTLSGNPDLVNKIDQQISKLKEQIASRVAQLKLVEKRGIIGVLTDSNNTQIKITDFQNNIRIVDVDELTKFASPSVKGNFGISDISKGTVIGVLGNYNKDSKHILARFVDVLTLPKTISGVVASIDNKNYVFQIVTVNQGNLLIDVENITKTFTYTKSDGLKRIGFSKLKIGDRVYIVGFPDIKVANQIVASRITRFPELPINPKLQGKISVTPSPSITITPTDTPTPTTKKKPTPTQ